MQTERCKTEIYAMQRRNLESDEFVLRVQLVEGELKVQSSRRDKSRNAKMKHFKLKCQIGRQFGIEMFGWRKMT